MEFFPLPTGMAVLAGISLIVAILCHRRIRGFWRASLASAVVTPLIFLVACLLQAGVPDSLGPMAFLLFAGFALLVALAVGGTASIARRFLPVGA